MTRNTRSRSCLRTVTAAAAAVVAALALAGCGGEGSTNSGNSDSTEGVSKNANTADVQAAMDKALLTHVDMSSVDPTIQEAFEIAAQPLSEDQEATALECWKSNNCKVPGGGDITVGISDGFGGNGWRQYSKMEAILQALAYPSVGKIIYLDANFDLAKMQSNVRSLVAQGADVIVGYNDFGAAMAPTFAAAQRSGAKVATYASPVPDATQDQVAAQVIPDLCELGKAQADATAEAIGGSGEVAYFNGTPGNPQGKEWNRCATERFDEKYPDISVAASQDTSWTPDGAYKAASALIATGKPIKAILYDYADPMTQVYKAYEQAGKTPPAFVTWTVNNDLNKLYVEAQGTKMAFPLVYTNGTNWTARVSITAAMDALAGDDVEAKIIFPQPFVQATEKSWVQDRPGDFVESTLIPESILDQMTQG